MCSPDHRGNPKIMRIATFMLSRGRFHVSVQKILAEGVKAIKNACDPLELVIFGDQS